MNATKITLLSAFIFALMAVAAIVFLPARLDYHSDGVDPGGGFARHSGGDCVLVGAQLWADDAGVSGGLCCVDAVGNLRQLLY